MTQSGKTNVMKDRGGISGLIEHLKFCGFCSKEARLQNSHVLPAFLFRWLRERGLTGHIRFSENPNRRVQDGIKKPWFCLECEMLFSGYETAFASKFFYPWVGGTHRIAYDDWLLRFCISISWRVLNHCKSDNPLAAYSATQDQLSREASDTWHKFLNGKVEHPGRFECHLIAWDDIGDTTIPNLPSNINRYLQGAIEMDIVGTNSTLYTFAKMGPAMLFGVIQKGSDLWDGTKVHVKHGIFEQRKIVLPLALTGLLRDKAKKTQEIYSSISDAQKEKINAIVDSDLGRVADSGQLKSLLADARLFGDDAILRKE
jgi:hypothetical protein